MDPIVVALAGWIAAWFLWGRPRLLRGAGQDVDPARVLVVIPARNEEAVLGGLLADLTAPGEGPWRIVVVDDHSTDDTFAVAQAVPGVEVVPAPALPAGWTGKSWACQAGVAVIDTEDTVVFLDADVRVAPGAIAAAVAQVHQGGSLVSVQPFHTTRRPDEQLSLFPGIVSMMGTGTGGRGEPSGVFGPLLATRVDHYRVVGGHASVRSEIAEDVALGLRYRAKGLPVSVLLGGSMVRFRMYPAGLAQLVEGWTKNMATGAGAVPRLRSLLTALWITAAGTAWLSLPGVPGNDGVAPSVGVALYLAFAVQIWWLGRTLGTFGPLTALLYPLPLAGFMALFARSVWRMYVRRSVQWRGRTIGLGGAGPVP